MTAVDLGRLRGRPLRGEIELPGDKSMSHRALIIASLADGRSRLRRLAPGRDVASTAKCLRQLGVSVLSRGSPAEVIVTGRSSASGGAAPGYLEPAGVLDCGNSGTTMRLLLGVLAGQDLFAVLTGDGSLRRRPMKRITAPLRQMGARILGRDDGAQAPLAVEGGNLRPAAHRTEAASAQVKSSLLLAGLFAPGTSSVTEPGQSRDHTERMLAAAGASVRRVSPVETEISGPAALKPLDLMIPGDPSSAAFLAAAALLVPGSSVTLRRVSLNPTRTGLFRLLARAGARVELRVAGEEAGEPWGDILVRHSEFGPLDVVASDVPALVDEIPLIGLLATRAGGRTTISGAAELRVKESDRLAATAEGLRALGATVEESPDGLAVEGPVELAVPPEPLKSHGDHRMAMTWAVASLVAGDGVKVAGSGAMDVSYPGFLGDLATLAGCRP
jgi:3-phosphoshikimate 1-carboxyvinyltransferase